MSDRVYRKAEMSDLPAKLVSTRWGTLFGPHFIVTGISQDFGAPLPEIKVDVTPTYKYGIWNHKTQRFLTTTGGTCLIFYREEDAHVYLREFQRTHTESSEFMKRFYVTKFDYVTKFEVPSE